MARESRYNIRKFQVLQAVIACEKYGLRCQSNRIARLTGLSQTNVRECVNQLKMSYITPIALKKPDERCPVAYKISKKGLRCYLEMKERYENGYDLNIRKKPSPVDYSGFDPLPGLEAECQ